MKRLLTATVALLALVAFAPAVQAQGGGGGGGGGGRMRMQDALFKDITLSTAQQTKVDSIVAHYRQEMGPMGGGRPDSAVMAKRRGLMDKEVGDFRAVLDAEQQKVFDKNVGDWKERMNRRRPPGS